jgi:hypothetical protein
MDNLYAILIGITEYKHYEKLGGATKDAKKIESFLHSRGVPKHRITKLLNGEATKDRIIREIAALQDRRDIAHGDPILLYFAGHGTRSQAPEGYETYSTSGDGKLETLCPVDMTCFDMPGVPVTGIPDIVLGSLIGQIASKKGDNIVRFRAYVSRS